MKRSAFVRTALFATGILISPAALQAHESGDWILRVGAATVAPDESSSVISTTATGRACSYCGRCWQQHTARLEHCVYVVRQPCSGSAGGDAF
jgi:outer membrane protein W